LQPSSPMMPDLNGGVDSTSCQTAVHVVMK
jgi:hypothetical protein